MNGVDWRLGPIGFAYASWSGTFYPTALPTKERLAFCARHFDAVELDTTFYAVPTPERMAQWASAVPAHFRFSLKAPRDITHGEAAGSLVGPEATAVLEEFLTVTQLLGDKLGAVLLQFPHTFGADRMHELGSLIDRIGGRVPLAVELRNEGWYRRECLEMFKQFGVVVASADRAPVGHAFLSPDDAKTASYRPFAPVDTGQFLYFRWSGRHDQYPTGTHELGASNERLAWWLRRASSHLTEGRLAYGFVGNAFAGHAPGTLRNLAEQLGLPASAVEPIALCTQSEQSQYVLPFHE